MEACTLLEISWESINANMNVPPRRPSVTKHQSQQNKLQSRSSEPILAERRRLSLMLNSPDGDALLQPGMTDPSLLHSYCTFKGLHLSPCAVCIFHISFMEKPGEVFFCLQWITCCCCCDSSEEPSRPNNTVIIYELNRTLPPDSLWQKCGETRIFLPQGRI